MILVIAIAALLWGLGHMMKIEPPARWLMIALLFVAVLFVHVLLPDGHAVREMTGGSAVPWLLLAGTAGVVMAYRAGLGWLKARAGPDVPMEAPAPARTFGEVEIERYARHIVLREIGGPGQKRLREARVLVIGAGGLGSPVLLYLAAAGVGTIGVIDDDDVDHTNLQRQVIHDDGHIGTAKVHSAKDRMIALNPYATVRPYKRRLTPDIAAELFAEYDVILDGTDNFDTRYLANRTAVAAGLPLISGALTQWEGQISVFDPARGAPCYQCVFASAPAAHLAPACAEAGVLGPLPGVVGSMMAVEAVKLITDAGTPLRGAMLIYDALHGETRTIGLKPRADCPICGGGTKK